MSSVKADAAVFFLLNMKVFLALSRCPDTSWHAGCCSVSPCPSEGVGETPRVRATRSGHLKLPERRDAGRRASCCQRPPSCQHQGMGDSCRPVS